MRTFPLFAFILLLRVCGGEPANPASGAIVGADGSRPGDPPLNHCDGRRHSNRCGNGVINPGEECDDGNCDETDACTLMCRGARCGDAIVWAGAEECDDGNSLAGDGCEPDCHLTPACASPARATAFGVPTSAASPLHPARSATADLDGDGRPDFVVSTWATRGVSLYFDPATRGLASPTRLIEGATTSGVAVGDLDGDGSIDLALTVGTTLRLRFGDGHGNFSSTVDVGSFADAPTLLAVDLDGDGRSEIVGVDYLHNRVWVVAARPDRTASVVADVAVGVGPHGLAVGDVDRDGDLDVVAGNASDMTVSVLLGAGDGSLVERMPRLSARYRPTSLALGDVDCDGWLDLIAASYQNRVLAIHSGAGGVFAPTTHEALAGVPTELRVVDLDANGAADIVLAMAATPGHPGSIEVRLANGPALFDPPFAIGLAEYPTSVSIADFDADGTLDVMSGNERSVSLVLQAPAP